MPVMAEKVSSPDVPFGRAHCDIALTVTNTTCGLHINRTRGASFRSMPTPLDTIRVLFGANSVRPLAHGRGTCAIVIKGPTIGS